MKKILLAALMLLPALCQAQWSSWTPDQRQWYMASNLLLMADWTTTRDMTRRYHEGYREYNPVLGSRPSTQKVDLYFLSAVVGHYLLADYLSSDRRTIYLQIVTGIEGAVVANNLNIGLRLRF